MRTCDYPNCGETKHIVECECCAGPINGLNHFCRDHGTRGGDDPDGIAYPSICWKCKGETDDD